MKKPEPPSKTVFPWLRANLGKNCLAPLTGTDARALRAAVEIIDLYSVDRDLDVIKAFGIIVLRMQPHCRQFAFHAIAHVLDWGDRRSIWIDSGLAGENLDQFPKTRCQFEY